MIDVKDTWRDSALCGRLPVDEAMETFFPEDINPETIARARRVCRLCPVFEQCHTWGQDHFPDVPDGILFGYPALDRGLMYRHRLRFRDWRNDGLRISRMALAAREREALRKGVPAVVNAHRYYDIEDPHERERVIAEYREWQDAQRYPSSIEESSDRVKYLSEAWLNPAAGSTRLPPELRPQCPEHGGATMYRDGTTTDGRKMWKCILMECRYRIVVGEPTRTDRAPRDKPGCPNGHPSTRMDPKKKQQHWKCCVCGATVPYPQKQSAA